MEIHVVMLPSAIKFTGGVVDTSASFAAVKCFVSVSHTLILFHYAYEEELGQGGLNLNDLEPS